MREKHSSFEIKNGYPYPLGVSKKDKGINFAIFSSNAERMSLSLFEVGTNNLLQEVILDTEKNKTGNIWHIFIENLPETFDYAYRLAGPFNPEKGLYYDEKTLVSDPCSHALSWDLPWSKTKTFPLKSRYKTEKPFDWEDTAKPNLPLADLIIYEMHIRGFTNDPSSRVAHPGTYLGVIEKIPYLKDLGINAVELMPVFEFDETANPRINPKTNQPLTNYWGYSPINFFTPMNRYKSFIEKTSAEEQFKQMVKELHKHGIEVFLDVVYNHTAEGDDPKFILNYKGIDNPIYYLIDEKGHYLNYSGCGNTFHCNHIVVRQHIIESLRFWVSEMQIDGFRFDLASILTRDSDGRALDKPPLIEMISLDPAFTNTKLIAEAWDCAGLYQVGTFPSWGKWMEWNGMFRDTARKYFKEYEGLKGPFASCISGSQNLYGDIRTPCHSINYITAHDGFTLKDLVSYTHKQNEENGENNQDGTDQTYSFNCGKEGPTDDPIISRLRLQQMKNFFLTLFISQGTPMIQMGDEYGHTRYGNNNAWCQDNALNWFQWDQLESTELFNFVKQMIAFRKAHPALGHSEFLTQKNIDWHSETPFEPKWEEKENRLAFTIKEENGNHLYIAINPSANPITFTLPSFHENNQWYRKVDTSFSPPEDFSDRLDVLIENSYTVQPHSSIILQNRC